MQVAFKITVVVKLETFNAIYNLIVLLGLQGFSFVVLTAVSPRI